MCTVTFIPVKDKFFITSNRDEKLLRKQAIPPAEYDDDDIKLIYPKDANANGSWIALTEYGNAAVLLNGAFTAQQPCPPYSRSRGLIFLEIIKTSTPVKYFLDMRLHRIEPFTLVLFEENSLFECRWDGKTKHCRQLKKYRPYIWSSATLYTEEIIKKREYWFAKFLNKNPHPSQQDIFHFHQFAGDGDVNNDLLMQRDGIYNTVSVTGIELTDEIAGMKYVDLKDNKKYNKEIHLLSLYEVAKEPNYA